MTRYRIYNRRTKTNPFAGHAGRVAERRLDPETAKAWAERFLPSAALAVLDLDAGAWTAPLPETIPHADAHRFDEGMLPEPARSEWTPVDLAHFDPAMARKVANDLECEPEDLILVPKWSLLPFAAQWTREHLAAAPTAIALVREMNESESRRRIAWESALGVLYPLAGATSSLDEIMDWMEDAAGAREEFTLLTSCDRLDPCRPIQLSTADLEELFASADGLILGAYDGEGYLRWRRERRLE